MSSTAEIDLANAVVAITGAGRGIGRATAAAFLRRGAVVAIGDLDADAAADSADQLGARAHAFPLDVSSRESFAAFLEAVGEQLGPIDVLVNNAGIMAEGRFLEESDAVTAAQIDVNLRGPIVGMKLALPAMIERGRGHVVNVASYIGKTHVPGLAVYGASKHGVVGLSAAVAAELEGSGVTLTAILPSAVETELSAGIDFPFARFAKVKPEDVAEAIVASCGDRPLERAVPRWLAAYEPLNALLPRRAMALIRRLIRDDRALSAIDPIERAAYSERIERQTRA